MPLDCKRQTGQRRLSRNESEKLRRDKLNMHIAELAKLVPLVATAPRKLDKSSVLRLSVNYLRTHYELKKAVGFELQRPSFLSKQSLEELLLETCDGFLLIVSQTGTILYTSHMISSLLGHFQVDVIGTSMYQLIHPDDIPLCTEQFQSFETNPDIGSTPQDLGQGGSSLTTAYAMPKNGRRSFYVRMLNLLYKEQKSYELVHMVCHVRNFTLPQRRDAVIVGVGRLVSQQAIHEMTVQPSNTLEFVSQHSLDGKFIYVDKRQALCNGRLPHEMYGKVPYDFILEEDLPVVQFSHQRIMVEGEIGSTVFRTFASTGEILFMESSSIIWLDKWTKAPKFIVSNNVLISEMRYDALMSRQKCLMDKASGQSGSESDGEASIIKRPRLDSEIIDITNSPDEQTESIDLTPETVPTSAEQILGPVEEYISLGTPNRDKPPDGCSPPPPFQLEQSINDDSLSQIHTPNRENPSISPITESLSDQGNEVTENSSSQSSQDSTSSINQTAQKISDPQFFKSRFFVEENTSSCLDEEKHLSDQTIPDKENFSQPVGAIEIKNIRNNQDIIDSYTFKTDSYDDCQIMICDYRIESSKRNISEQHSSSIQKSGCTSYIEIQENDRNPLQLDNCENQNAELNSVVYSKQVPAPEEECSGKTGLVGETINSLSHSQTRERSENEPLIGETCEADSVRNVLDDQNDTISSSLVNADEEVTHTIQTEDNEWLQELASSAISSSTGEVDQLSVSYRKEGSAFTGDRASRVQPQSNLKRVPIQTHLANQLQTKYQQLDGRLKKQESELSELKNELLKYLLSHPEAREAYMERLNKLESKRQGHEENLRSLQNMCQINSRIKDEEASVHPRVTAMSETPSLRDKVSAESINIPSDLSTCMCLPFSTYSEEKLSIPSLISDRGDNSTKSADINVSAPEFELGRGSNRCYRAIRDGSAACAHHVTHTERQSLFSQFLNPRPSLEGYQHNHKPDEQTMCPAFARQSKRRHRLVDKQSGCIKDEHGRSALIPVCTGLDAVYGHRAPHIDRHCPSNTDLTAACSSLHTPPDAQSNQTTCAATDMDSPQTEAYGRWQSGLPTSQLNSTAKDPALRGSAVKQSVDSRSPDTTY